MFTVTLAVNPVWEIAVDLAVTSEFFDGVFLS